MTKKCEIKFAPGGKSVVVNPGTSLLDAAAAAGLSINSVCGGSGVCGRCRMLVTSGQVSGGDSALLSAAERDAGMVLACQAVVKSDLTVEIPAATRAKDKLVVDRAAARFQALSPGITPRPFSALPLIRSLSLALPPPNLDDHLADFERLARAVENETGLALQPPPLPLMRRLPEVMRKHSFMVTATLICTADGESAELIDLAAGKNAVPCHVAVIDVGTSTVVIHLVDTTELRTVSGQACFNSQAVHGRDVVARIMVAEKKGEAILQELVMADINRLLALAASDAGIDVEDICGVVCAGNTTMMHLLLALPSCNIRRTPFVPVTVEPGAVVAADVGIRAHPQAPLVVVPGVSGWVGGDITAGILATGLHERAEIAMLVDIGTNGEVVVGNHEWLVAAAASVGPAFEGAGVSCGMVAAAGAVETVTWEQGQPVCRVIGGGPAEGICGSGIIDLVAILLEHGIIDRSGKFVDGSHSALCTEDGLTRFVLVPANQTAHGNEIAVTQHDLENVVTAKAAVFAAVKILLDRLSLTFADISTLFLAGGFGSYVNRKNAVSIGLLPDLPVSRIQYAGNTSLWGAKFAALSQEAFQELGAIRRRTTYYDLLGSDDYVEQFSQAMFLPHTHIELFPSVQVMETGTESTDPTAGTAVSGQTT
jgi:uncharacterized 2Fe-2S/4Fe-4S cluster protein (DUF4445 family)